MREHFRKVAEPVVEPYTSATLCLLTAEQPDPVVAAGQYFDAWSGKIEPIIGLVGVGVGVGLNVRISRSWCEFDYIQKRQFGG